VENPLGKFRQPGGGRKGCALKTCPLKRVPKGDMVSKKKNAFEGPWKRPKSVTEESSHLLTVIKKIKTPQGETFPYTGGERFLFGPVFSWGKKKSSVLKGNR